MGSSRIHPTALLGMVGFFLPWLQVSCGPVRLSVSGYDLASGNAGEKFGPEHTEEFRLRFESDLANRTRTKHPHSMRPVRPSEQNRDTPSDSVPFLWTLPAACTLLFVLGMFGVPRAATLSVASIAGAYLAYFFVTTEQELSDPAFTGGIFESKWLFGFWAVWMGLVVPAVVALLKPRQCSPPPS